MGFLSKLRNSLKDDLINPSFSLTKKAKGASLDIADSIISNPKRTAIIATSPIWVPTAVTIGAAASPFIAAKGAYDLSGKNKKTKWVRDHTVGYALDAMDEGSKLGVGVAATSFSEPRRRPDGTLDVDWDFSAPWGYGGNIQEWEEEAKRQGYDTGGKNPIKSLANTYYALTRIAAKAEREDKETPEGVKVALDYGLDPTMYISPGTIGKGSTKLGLASTGLGKMLLGAEGVGATSRTARIIGGLLEGSPKTALGMAAGAGAAAEITSRTPWGGDDYFGSLLGSAVGGITQGKINNSLKKPGIKSNIITDTYGDVFRDFKTTVDESGIINKGPKLATGNKWIEMLNKAGITKKELEAGDILEELSARGNEQLTRAQILEIINKYNFDVEEKIYSGDEATYGQYVVPGTDPGTYREILITQVTKPGFGGDLMKDWEYINAEFPKWKNGEFEIVFYPEDRVYNIYQNNKYRYTVGTLEDAKNIASRLTSMTSNNQWPNTNNVLMHLRVADKDDGRTLFVHEIQSDWAQEERSGKPHHVTYNSEKILPEYTVSDIAPDKKILFIERPEEQGGLLSFQINSTDDGNIQAWSGSIRVKEAESIEKLVEKIAEQYGIGKNKAIPFPFPDNWQTVGVKRLLRYAAENGYSRIEFARGEDTLNIDGMGLEKGSTNELGRLNSYNGSISFRETKEGQPGDYRIIQADKVGEYTRYSVKFNDDIVTGDENNTYVFFVENGEKLTESIVNEALWKEYRNTPGSKIYDGRNLRPHKGTGLPGIAEGLAKKIGLSVEKQPRYASSYESLEHDAVISLHDLDLDEWQENVDIALNTGAITSEQAKDIKKVFAHYIGMRYDFSLYEYLGEIFKNPDKYSQEVKDANRFFEIMGWSNKNIESTPSTIINLLPEGKANLLSKPQTIFGMVGDDQGFENKLREDSGNKPRSGGIKLFLDKMEESVRGLGSGNANVTNNSVGVDSRDGNIIDLLRKNRQDRLAAMRDQMLTPASPELPKDVLAGEAVDTDTAWQMRAQQAREEAAAGQNFNPEQVPAPRQVIPQNTADPFGAPARPESNEFTQLGRSVGPEYVPDDGMTPDEYVPVQPKKPVKPFNEFIPMPATGNNGEIKVTVNGKEEIVRYKRPDISADWRPVTLKDYLEGIIWRNQAIMKEEDTLGLGDGKTAIIGPEQGSARIGSELDFKRTKRRLSNPNNFERPVAPINIGNHRLRAAELLEGLTKEELEQQLPDDVDFPDLFSSLIGARYISEITDKRMAALAARQQVVEATEAGAHSVGGEIVDIQNTTVNSPKGGQSGTASTQAATGDNNGGGIAAVATVAEPDEVKPTLRHLGDVRNFSDVVAKVKTYNNPIIRFLIGRTQINPSILFNTPVGKAIVAKYRQDLVIEELTNAAVTATLDPFTRAGGVGIGTVRMGADEKGIIKLKSGQKVHWNDVLSDLNTYKPMLNSHQIAYAETFNEVLNDIRTLRDIHGLDNLPVEVNGKLWVPRTVSGVKGLELETPRASNHRLDRIYETATEGVENGITYADPRDTLKLYIYDTYREIVNKQFADEIERVTPGIESLVSKTTIDKYNKWKNIYATEREKYKVIAEQYANSGTARQRDASLREMMNQQKKRVDRAKAIYNTHQERYNNALTRAKDAKFIGVDNLSTPREVKTFSLSGKSERIVSRKDHKFLSNYIGVTGIVPAQTENIVTKSFNAFGKTIRTATATFDFAAPFTHNLPSLAVNPRGWAKSTAMQYAAYVNPKVKANYIRDNAQIINEMASYGVPVGASEYFEGTARNGPIETVYRKAIKPIPVAGKVVGITGRQTVGRFESAMETALLVNRVEMWKANREAFMKENHGFLHSGIGVTDNGLDGLAQFVRNVTGGLDSRALMVDKNHRDLESVWLAFSPKLMRSTFALMGMAMKPNTREGRAALRSLALLSGGSVAAFYLLNRAFGNSHEDSVEAITPTSGRKFLAVKLDDGYYGIGGQIRAVATLLANSEQVMESGDYSKFATWNQFDNPILNFYTSRGSPGVSLAQNAIESSTGLNSNPFEEVNGPKGFLLTTSKDFLPFLAQSYIQGKDILGENPEDPESSMKSLIFSANGLRTIPFSRSEERDMAVEAEGYTTSDGVQAKTVKDLNDKQRKDFYEKHPVYQIDPVNDNVTKYFTSISEINDQFDQEVLMMAANVNSGKMSKEAFRKWYNDANKNRYSKIDGSKKAFELVPAERYGFKGSVKDYLESRDSRPEDKAVDKYYTLATEVPLKNDGTYDFEEVARRKEAFMKSLSNETRAYVIEMTSSSRRDRLENDVMTEYDIVKKTTKPFFEAENEVFSYMHKNSKFFAQFKDKEAYQAWIDETANGYGITSDTLATVLGSKFPDIKAYNKIESEYKRLMRIKNPELDRSLVEWYGMEPANRLEYTLNNFGLSGGDGLAQAVAADRSLNSTKADLSLGLNLRREGYKLTNRKFRRPYYSLK